MPNLKLKVPPVAQAIICLPAMWLFERYLPLLPLGIPYKPVFSAILIFTGGAIGIAGILSFVKEKTTVDPRTPEKSGKLVIKGIYNFSRNPMYLGILIVLLGIALFLGDLSSFLPIPLFILSMNRLQITPEEDALEEIFGESYRNYRKKVRRWL